MIITLRIPLPNFSFDKVYTAREFTHRYLDPDGSFGVCLALEVISDNGQPLWYTERPSASWHKPWDSFMANWVEKLPSSPKLVPTFLVDKILAHYELEGKFSYYPAQKEALKKCIHRENVLLVGDTGTGKTLLGLTLLNINEGEPINAVKTSLIIVPQAVIPQWIAEAGRYFPEMNLITLEEWLYEQAAGVNRNVIVVTHPERLFITGCPTLTDRLLHTVLLDESHIYGNLESLLTGGVTNLRARHRLALSATPIPNRVVELFPILWWLSSCYRDFPYGSTGIDAFKADCFTSDGSFTRKIEKILEPLVVTLEKHECRPGVPKLTINRVKLIPNDQLLSRLAKASPHRQRELLWTRRFQQQKMVNLLKQLAHITSKKEQLLVVCSRVKQTDEYAEILTSLGIPFARIDSEVRAKYHSEQADLFKNKEVPVLFMGSKCAQSHSFPQCNNLWIGSMGYSYSEFWQTIGRVWRVNSPNPITVTIPYYEDTTESRLWSYVKSKESLARATLFCKSILPGYITDRSWWAKTPIGGLNTEHQEVAVWETILKRCLDRK